MGCGGLWGGECIWEGDGGLGGVGDVWFGGKREGMERDRTFVLNIVRFKIRRGGRVVRGSRGVEEGGREGAWQRRRGDKCIFQALSKT